MDTIEVILSIPAVEHDRYLAWLEDDATGFVQTEGELRAYIPADRWPAVGPETLEARLSADGYTDALNIRTLASKNWNEVWEETLTPVETERFVITPTSVRNDLAGETRTILRIDPEMSFGTGHHATTRLALDLLAECDPADRHVLDVGTGTGILAIAACRLKASSVLAVDTNSEAVRNARENVIRNDVGDCVTVREGSMDVVPNRQFDLVIANITRRVLIKLLPEFVDRLEPSGRLVLSGILRADRGSIREAIDQADLVETQTVSEDGWWAAVCTPSPTDRP